MRESAHGAGRTTAAAFKRWVLGAGVFNVVFAFPLAMPFFYRHYYALLDRVNTLLGLGGGTLQPPAEGANMLFINTAGLALGLVGLLLIYAAGDLRGRQGIPLLNGIVRIVFSCTAVYYACAEDIPGIILGFVAADLVIAGVFFYYLARLRAPEPSGVSEGVGGV